MAPVIRKEKKETQHIQAFARLRPFNKSEIECHSKSCLEINGKDILVHSNHGSKKFSFDKVFGAESKQRDVYMTIVSPIIKEVMQGYNCTVFAYGQTGTGKTYTMIGDPSPANISYTENSDSGIIPRTLGHLFENLRKTEELDFTVRVSYLELYNEVLIDLLSTEDKVLKIYEDPRNKGSVQIHGLEEVTIFAEEQVYEILQAGNDKKITASTMMNAHSSRSHTVFTITLHSRETTPEGEEVVKTGKLNLVDLAGSENISRSGANQKRAREAGNINQSLLSLERVIKGLLEKNAHIPYRESKLTRILQDSLGGKTKTTIIATVSPASNNLEETLTTLDYAFRARNITNRPEVNEKMSKTALIQKYLEEIERLKKDVVAARTGDGVYLDKDNYNLLVGESEKRKKDLLRIVEECSQFEGRVQELDRVREELEQVYSVTKRELADSNLNLNKCKTNLKKYRTQRQIHQDLIDKYDAMQTHLFEDRKLLSKALSDYNSDNTALRNKVDELYQVINMNHSTSKSLVKNYNQQHEKMSADVVKLSEMVRNNMNDFKELIVDKSIECKTLLSSNKDKTLNMAIECTKAVYEIQTDIKQHLIQEYNYLVQEMKLSEQVAKTIISKMKTKNKTVCQNLDILLKKITEMCESNTEIAATSKNFNADMFYELNNGVDKVILMQGMLGKAIEKDVDNLKLMEQKLVNAAQRVDDVQELVQKEMVSDYEDLIAEIKDMVNCKINNSMQRFNGAKESLAEMKTTQTMLTKGVKQILESHKTSCVDTNHVCTTHKNYLQQMESDVNRISDENEAVFERFTNEIRNNSKEVINLLEENTEIDVYIDSVQNDHSHRNDTYKKHQESLEKTFTNQLQGLVNELQGLSEDTNEMMEVGVSMQTAAAANMNDKLGTLETAIINNLNDHQSAIGDIQGLLTSFSEDLINCKPKGDTPIRKKDVIRCETPKRVTKNILQKLDAFKDETLDESLLEMSLTDSELDISGVGTETLDTNSFNEKENKNIENSVVENGSS